jgi:hypothetical protein
MGERESHGMCGTKIYDVWCKIRQRCLNPNAPNYKNYGGRGIGICPEWERSFVAFYSHVGDKPDSMESIDRINNDGDYEPGNVRWATKADQNRNSRANRMVEVNGEQRCMAEAARLSGMKPEALRSRLRLGWSTEDALSIPISAARQRNG